MNLEDWHLLVPLIQYVCNHKFLKILGGHTLLEVMTGRSLDVALDLALWWGTHLEDAECFKVAIEKVNEYVEELVDSLCDLHELIGNKQRDEACKQAAKEAEKRHGVCFNVGDLVMVAGCGNSAHIKPAVKGAVLWQGPYEVLGERSTMEFEVGILGSKHEQPGHMVH